MTEIAGRAGHRADGIVRESYSFACMRCGYGWEQSYEIEHHTDTDGHDTVRYVADGRVVPSPLSRPTCRHCDGHVVRIMRPGRVASARGAAHREHHEHHEHRKHHDHRWHLSDLLPSFRRAG
ncbi:hypothetical protein JL475_16675 [Streptomyces sp. M2CJ-2]|uniref:hypothetical protein n=1 Tax=Streptomyces sp. M2CJ-2 TaxID=2803948 RepID=UPI0019258EA4|nr:hypothetical protein [Streptomyces sp. M2CJ-2]MBL3667591.1 hypothetical protein [Streptomyces sp. M2CJ-2]